MIPHFTRPHEEITLLDHMPSLVALILKKRNKNISINSWEDKKKERNIKYDTNSSAYIETNDEMEWRSLIIKIKIFVWHYCKGYTKYVGTRDVEIYLEEIKK